MEILEIVGTIFCFLGSILLAIWFGITFKGNKPGVYTSPAKFWLTIKITTMERGQKVSYGLLVFGFLLILLSKL